MIRTIAVGVDPTPAAQLALEWAAGLAHEMGAKLVVVHGADLVERFRADAESEEAFEDGLRHRIEREWLGPVRRRGVLHELVVRPQPALDLLLEVGAAADLIVVGRRTGEGPIGTELGSTSRQLVSRATVPVVVVPV